MVSEARRFLGMALLKMGVGWSRTGLRVGMDVVMIVMVAVLGAALWGAR